METLVRIHVGALDPNAVWRQYTIGEENIKPSTIHNGDVVRTGQTIYNNKGRAFAELLPVIYATSGEIIAENGRRFEQGTEVEIFCPHKGGIPQ